MDDHMITGWYVDEVTWSQADKLLDIRWSHADKLIGESTLESTTDKNVLLEV